MRGAAVTRTLVVGVAVAIIPLAMSAFGVLNIGQALNWISFLAALVAGLAFLAAMGGRENVMGIARSAFFVQWFAYALAAFELWRILFTHDFRFQYVASYSSLAMPAHYVYAAFWGGQEGTFMLWALLTATLGLVLMRGRHALTTGSMFFLNLPLIMLGLVTVMRGPFLVFAAGNVPVDGNGLNPLLQDPWMTIHPPVLFTGFSSFVVPFAIACSAHAGPTSSSAGAATGAGTPSRTRPCCRGSRAPRCCTRASRTGRPVACASWASSSS